ncbi:MAG: NADH:ubiquinone reductase (Na(+)-transporting) subunit C [Flavobacteriaceae bacterium]|nr:NADH:ubiquinone reductase (Na(+)-transporting) subunit C [Flavobacteriaceae bacterium]
MDRNSNSYTFLFAIIMVVVIASLLAYTSTTLKPLQDNNVKNETMQNILSSIGENVDRDGAEVVFNKYIKQQLALKSDGTVDPSVDAFTINMKNEIKKPADQQRYPLYVAEKDGQTYYIVPLWGNGLWDAIWGYVALESDENTIKGAKFDHKGETPGLGAEIKESWFGAQYNGKQILDADGDFVSVTAIKGGAPQGDIHGVDGISGGTITSDAVSAMISERLAHYLPYFKNN